MDATSYNHVNAVQHKYAYQYLCELMTCILSTKEEQVVLLHCGFNANETPLTFLEIANVLCISSPLQAKRIYQTAIKKIRIAIPGSKLEHWINGYNAAYYPGKYAPLHIEIDAPIMDWDT